MANPAFDRMKEVDAAVKKLDPAVRAEAFSMMRDYILAEEDPPATDVTGDGGKKVTAPREFDAFVDTFETDVPGDNAVVLAAWLYAEYGNEPFSMQEIKDLADRAQMTIPNRPDVTLGGKSVNKKKIFRRVGKNFRPTVDGETFLRTTHGVKKGNKKRQPES